MLGISESELLLYSGIVLMAAAILLALLSIIIFVMTGRQIRKKLEQEYGESRGKRKCPK